MAEVAGMIELIERKKKGGTLSQDELHAICTGYLSGSIPDYQMAAWLMAVRFQGLDRGETVALTRSLIATGATLEWPQEMLVVDKHSTGGVGDKTSLVLVPLIAAAGLTFVKMSGRGLGHTGGTLDKLESIPGFDVTPSLEAVRAQVAEIGCALIGQTAEMVPGDGAIYALRDATSTVDSVPLIASSIMSKKLAMGARALVLDVKWGSGAFMTTLDQAKELARTMVDIGTGFGVPVRAVLSPMEEPLGRAVGNSLEVAEAIETLSGRGPGDLRRLVLELGSHLMELTGQSADLEAARSTLAALLDSGAALAKFGDLIQAQGGDRRVIDDSSLLPTAPIRETVRAESDGWIERVDARPIADAALALGAGRRSKGEAVDHRTGVIVSVRTGDRVSSGDLLAEIHAADEDAATRASEMLSRAIQIDPGEVPAPPADFLVIQASTSRSINRPPSS